MQYLQFPFIHFHFPEVRPLTWRDGAIRAIQSSRSQILMIRFFRIFDGIATKYERFLETVTWFWMFSFLTDWPNDKLDFTLAIWQVGFYLAQTTSWILPCPNDKLDFTLPIWQYTVKSRQHTLKVGNILQSSELTIVIWAYSSHLSLL